MPYKKVLLIQPDYKGSHYEYAGLPVGLGYISEALSRAGIEHSIADMRTGMNETVLMDRIRDYSPDLIGLTMMSFRYRDHYALAEKIKKEFSGIAVIAGGPHLSTFRERVLKDCAAIDFGSTLEGEETLAELCGGKRDTRDIKGLLYRDGGRVEYTGDRDFIRDLDGLGFPKYGHFDTGSYPRFVSILTSRGCPHSCIFCPVKLTIGKRLRVRSASSVTDEIEWWYRKGVRVFNIVDDNFTFNKKRVLDICSQIREKGISDIALSCRNGIRADTVDREILQAMKEAGFNYLAFGVESASQKVLDVLKKGESLAEMERAIKDACDLGYMVTLFFIVGLPYETEQDVLKSLDFAKRFSVFDVRFYNPIPFPGTELYEWVDKNGYFTDPSADYLSGASHWLNMPIFSTPELPFRKRRYLYKRLNSEIKKHTFKTKMAFSKDIERLFINAGLPALLSRPLARVYYTDVFQRLVIESGIGHSLKNIFAGKGRR
jgi:radical SAM superfamily enzyme YgiQ (UPF0313 family)